MPDSTPLDFVKRLAEAIRSLAVDRGKLEFLHEGGLVRAREYLCRLPMGTRWIVRTLRREVSIRYSFIVGGHTESLDLLSVIRLRSGAKWATTRELYRLTCHFFLLNKEKACYGKMNLKPAGGERAGILQMRLYRVENP